MERDELYWNSPAMVEVEYHPVRGDHNGRRGELAFATRLEAEAYVGQVAALQLAGDDEALTIFSATLRQAVVWLN